MSEEIVGLSTEGRNLLSFARKEAERLGHEHVGPEHLLLAMTAQREGPVATVLRNLAVDAQKVRDMMDSIVGPGKGTSADLSTPRYTLRARNAFLLAKQCADQSGDAEVGGVHLLLGLLREGDNVATQVLADHGLTEDKAVAAVRRANDRP